MGKDFDIPDFENEEAPFENRSNEEIAKKAVDQFVSSLNDTDTPQDLVIQELEKELKNPNLFTSEFKEAARKYDLKSNTGYLSQNILIRERLYKNELYNRLKALRGEEETRKQEGKAKEVFHLLNELGMLNPLLEYCDYYTGTKVEAEKKITKIFNKITAFEISPASTKDYIRIAKKEGDRTFSETIREAVREFLQNL